MVRVDKYLNPYIEPEYFSVGMTFDVIGNIGQYFTFRLPGREDDLEPTAATVDSGDYPLARPLFIYSTAEIMRSMV